MTLPEVLATFLSCGFAYFLGYRRAKANMRDRGFELSDRDTSPYQWDCDHCRPQMKMHLGASDPEKLNEMIESHIRKIHPEIFIE